MKDLYYVLGLDENCTLEQIKEAHRKLTKKFHPDLNEGDTYFASRFREVQEAYETLSDPVKRRRYDKKLQDMDTAARQGAYTPPKSQHQARPSDFKRHKTRPGAGMTIILLLVAIVVGVYLYKYLNKPKKIAPVAGNSTVVTVVPVVTFKHHRKKNIAGITAYNYPGNTLTDSESKKPSKAVPAGKINTKIKQVQAAYSNNLTEPQSAVHNNNLPVSSSPDYSSNPVEPLANKNVTKNNRYLYATYIKTNVTGVVNMRKTDQFGSVITETIPENSKILVLQKGGVYYKVSFNNVVGYVPKWSLEVK